MLYENEFNAIWENSLEKMIKEFSELFGVKYKPLFLLKVMLNYFYNKYKETTVKTYMVWDTINIDRHKIAACIMKSILVIKPLYIPLSAKLKFTFTKKKYHQILNHKIPKEKQDKNQSDPFRKYFLFYNEYLAINVAKMILDSYINSGDNSRFKHQIIVPEPFPETDHDYLRDFCIGLYYSKTKTFNPVTYANVLFLWEKYSCRKVQCDNLEAAYATLLKKDGMSEDEIEVEVKNTKLGNQTQINNNKDE